MPCAAETSDEAADQNFEFWSLLSVHQEKTDETGEFHGKTHRDSARERPPARRSSPDRLTRVADRASDARFALFAPPARFTECRVPVRWARNEPAAPWSVKTFPPLSAKTSAGFANIRGFTR
jgi:hypothetical protein